MRSKTVLTIGEFTAALAAQAHDTTAAVMIFCDAPQLRELVARLPAASKPTPAAELHLTLAFLGAVGQLPRDARAAADDAVAKTAAQWPPAPARINGYARFIGTDTDGDPLVALVDGGWLPGLRADLAAELARAGTPIQSEHGFTPHITLGYLPPAAPTPNLRFQPFEIACTELTLAWAGWARRWPLNELALPTGGMRA